jgi:acyl-CoA synthetase (AMP-forming)/AMP-acid ligase II
VSARDDLALGARTLRALGSAGVLRPVAPGKALRATRAARALGATPATSVAIGAATDPGGIALVDDDGAMTWAQLDGRARAIGGGLVRELGAGPDRAVALMCRNHRGFVEAMAAAAYAGADLLLLNTEFPGPQLAQALERSEIAAVVLDPEFAERFDVAGYAGGRVLTGAGESMTLDGLAAAGRGPERPPAKASSITMLTSGTTGAPKGAPRGELPVRAMLGPLVTMIEHLGLRRHEPILVCPPLFHGFGMGFMGMAQAIGAPLLLQRRFDPARALELIEEHRATCFVGVPAMLQRVLALDPAERAARDTSSLRAVVAAGAPLPPQLSGAFMDSFGDILFNAYGTTEVGFSAIARPADLRAAPGTIGRAPIGASLHILDGDRRPAAAGTTGHIFVGGEMVFDGYTGGGNKELVGDLMNTGDLGHVDAAGLTFVDGREDDMIVSGGENVFPQEVEDTLSTHPAVADVAVVGVDDDEFGQRLKAYVVAADGFDASAEELLDHVRARLARFKLPREIEFRAEIPRNPTGKVLKRQLA